jgi:peptide/nickel transport system permease protein
MTEETANANASYSKDYWDLVMVQLRRRPSVKIAMVLLAWLYAAAIFAPFIAGDRPLVLSATNAAVYKKARNTIVPVSGNYRDLVVGGTSAHVVAEGGQDWETALASEHGAVVQRAQVMRDQLTEADAGPLILLMEALERAHAAGLAGDTATAEREADAMFALAERSRAELAPAKAGESPRSGETVALVPSTTYPALDAISRGELYFMGLWLLVLAWPLWNRIVNSWWLRGSLERIRHARRYKALAMLALPLLLLPFWSSDENAFSSSPYKEGLTSGEVTATRAVMPPIPFGLAEINDGEYLRPPTWHRTSAITEDGYYAEGARSVRKDPQTGYLVPPSHVEMRYGEPERNAVMRHPLGTDSLGRDILARIVWGGRVSLSVGLVSTVFLVLIGTIMGALAGYFGGKTDIFISRIIEIFQCFPAIFLIMIVVAFLGPSIMNIMILLGVTRWTGVARLVRGEFLRLRGQDFVVASEALGVPQRRTIFRHILPNAMGPVLVAATFSVASGILTESALSFLGFGVKLPIPSWGSLLTESRSPADWWIQIFPGVMIFVTVMLYNLLGEGVRDALDPRLKKT